MLIWLDSWTDWPKWRNLTDSQPLDISLASVHILPVSLLVLGSVNEPLGATFQTRLYLSNLPIFLRSENPLLSDPICVSTWVWNIGLKQRKKEFPLDVTITDTCKTRYQLSRKNCHSNVEVQLKSSLLQLTIFLCESSWDYGSVLKYGRLVL